MVPQTQPDDSPQQLLHKWIGDLPYQLLLLEKVFLAGEFCFDYTPRSLDALEAHLLERDESVQDPQQRAELVESAMAYLGEVLLGVAGGGWGWNTRPVDDLPGQPVVRPDPELELSPVAPRLLIAHALRVGTGAAFGKEVERLRQAVTARQQEVPGWQPAKEYTPHVDPTAPLPEDPVLTAWLAERSEALPAWAEDAFNGSWRWNFHPDTLDWLEAVVQQRFATVEGFDAARDEPFVQGACWYMGEVIRRNKGAVWQYFPFDPDAEPGAPGSRESVWTEVPFVDQPDKRVGGAAIPLGCLRELFLEEADGGPKESLWDTLFWFRPSSYAHVGSLLVRMGMVSREKVDSVLAEYADFAHDDLPPHEVAGTLEAFGVAVSAHADDVDDLEDSYAGILERAEALTGGAVTITDVRLYGGEYGEVLEFARNGVPVTQETEHQSDDYLDHLAIMEFIGHVDPDPGDDPRRFYLVQFVYLKDANYDSYYVFATPEQAAVLEKELGLDLR
ncbi:hypothetical protein [Streptomyces sp. ISID311]|uniref:hypothetical protein n=1 Tax=Streptomyces sp. ISID311 TaxID=2601673 RepID=UPI0011BD312C|nr:hypothetical protein [Streptomyces sp. ISID311]TXC96106.1 hypothetical protein FS847_19225 [Streptomyces sp. ISID311]